MKLASLFLVFQIAGVAIAAATPRSWPMIASSEAENSDLQKRQQIDNYYITLCENKDYTGRCARIQAAWDICYSIIQENNEWASSAKSDAGGKCVLYENQRCTGGSLTVTSAGIADLYPLGFDNKVSAFKCGG